MSIFTHARKIYMGTAAERAGTTPSAEAEGVAFWETDNDSLYMWTGSAWEGIGGGGVGAGWKLGNVVVVSSSGDGDYTSVSTACSTEAANTLILVDEGTYTVDNVTPKAGQKIVGTIRGQTSVGCTTFIQSASGNPIFAVSNSGFGCSRIRFSSTGGGAGSTVAAITLAGGVTAEIIECYVEAENAGAGSSAIGIDVTNGTFRIVNCDFDISGDTNAYSVRLNGVGTVASITGGVFTENATTEYAIYGNGGGVYGAWNLPYLINGVGGTITSWTGSYNTPSGVVIEEGLTIGQEFIATPDEITATDAGVAASIATVNTEVTTNGDSDLDNVTLANGTSGQIKHIYCVVEGNAGDTWKITPANMVGGTQITFSGAGEGCTLVYADNEGWCVVANNGGTIS